MLWFLLPMMAFVIVAVFFITQLKPLFLTRAKSQILTRGMFAIFWAIFVAVLLVMKYRNAEEDIPLPSINLYLVVAGFCVLLNLARMYWSWTSQRLPSHPVVDFKRDRTRLPTTEYLPEFDFTKPPETQEPASEPKKSENT